jgi:hypothetical protein
LHAIASPKVGTGREDLDMNYCQWLFCSFVHSLSYKCILSVVFSVMGYDSRISDLPSNVEWQSVV